MNFLILTLALAIIAGSQSFVLQNDQAPVSLTAELNKKLEDLEDHIEKALDKKWEIIVNSETYQILDKLLNEEEEEEVEEKKQEDGNSDDKKSESEPQDAFDVTIDILSDGFDILEDFFNAIYELDNATEPLFKEFDSALEKLIAPYFDPILARLKPIVEPHFQKLAAKFTELDHKMEEKLKEFMAILDAKVPAEIRKLQDEQESPTETPQIEQRLEVEFS